MNAVDAGQEYLAAFVPARYTERKPSLGAAATEGPPPHAAQNDRSHREDPKWT